MENFILSETNPNDSTGGKGCLCSEFESADCKPPFVVFKGQNTQSRVSPHAVACRTCISRALERMEDPLEIQVVGNRSDSRPNLGRVSAESLDVVQAIVEENWIPEPGEDVVPPNLADELDEPEEVEAEILTPEEYHEKYADRDNKTIGKPMIEEEEVPSL